MGLSPFIPTATPPNRSTGRATSHQAPIRFEAVVTRSLVVHARRPDLEVAISVGPKYGRFRSLSSVICAAYSVSMEAHPNRSGL